MPDSTDFMTLTQDVLGVDVAEAAIYLDSQDPAMLLAFAPTGADRSTSIPTDLWNEYAKFSVQATITGRV